jgi:hypothetical protein
MNTIITNLAARDVTLTLDGDNIKVRAPAGALTDADRQLIRSHKADLIAALRTVTRASTPTRLPCSCPAICWPCCNRPCEMCGKPTGSAFIRRCSACGNLPDQSPQMAVKSDSQ